MHKVKSRKMFFIDGFNLYHAIKRAAHKDITFINAKWLDLEKLCSFFIDPNIENLAGIKYFTTISWKESSIIRQRNYLSELQAHSHFVDIIYGKFKQKDRFCPSCHATSIGHEEKLTDVNISIYLLECAFQNSYDEAVIVSADSDLIPAIKAVQRNFPNKIISVLPPFANAADDLKTNAQKKYKMTQRHLKESQLPDTDFYPRPAEWTSTNYQKNPETGEWEFLAPNSKAQ